QPAAVGSLQMAVACAGPLLAVAPQDRHSLIVSPGRYPKTAAHFWATWTSRSPNMVDNPLTALDYTDDFAEAMAANR
ncbi:hypothetical protein, partial [Mesorhizobium sp. M4B.F.Ca.ET.172.01.1.1]|uniref:hypothetical protein n=1 Tax=Mesorhizobium sp. M4B.F.Ca.ET.172.01.1.1 TaxID=2563950 RepID=UPI001AEE08C6